MKSPTKENIKQIATTKNYTTNVYIGSNDDEFISAINKSLNNAKYKIIGFESDGKKLVKNIKKEIKELEKKDINETLEQTKKLELGKFINENFEKLSKLLIDKIVVKKSDDKERVILNIYINLFNITYIWDYNNFEKISSFCSHNENYDCSSCNRKWDVRRQNNSK